jgi:hypothetical protein
MKTRKSRTTGELQGIYEHAESCLAEILSNLEYEKI